MKKDPFLKDRSRKRQAAAKSRGSFRRQAIYWLAAFLLVGAGLVWIRGYFGSKPTPAEGSKEAGPEPVSVVAEEDLYWLPEITSASFRNASATVGYVGSGECRECHRDEHKSYLKTTHSRSLGDVDIAHEPQNGEFAHDLSGRSYRIYRDHENLKLREFIHDASGDEVVLKDVTARFALGSGNYARMYLVKVDDFLVEAPMTWYPRLKTWGMSAGYELDAHQSGFNREIDANCLYCHAGRVEAIKDGGLRLSVKEAAIGCERCHGPGELHVRERKSKLPIQGSIDDSIVNLRHLSRERQEDVCSQCHLSASADVNVRGRARVDFRPGMRMADFVINYRIDRPDSAMTVSGQIEQMRLSRCYIESKTMTCFTCHNLHSLPEESERVDYYRQKCVDCHEIDACGIPLKTRQEKEPRDNCIICHMPRGPTDIPHFSFTHHRVGIHAEQQKSGKLTSADKLVPVVDVSQLPELERQRLLGLANDVFASKLAGGLNDETRDDPSYRALALVFEDRAKQILEEVRWTGLRDPEVEMFLSRQHWRKNPARCIEYAESALKSERISSLTRNSALYNLASSYFDQRQYTQAFPYLEQLVKLERSEISLMLLAICHQKKGNLLEAVRLIQEAIVASPDRADLHSYLASIYQEMGRTADAQTQLNQAKLLRLRVPQPE